MSRAPERFHARHDAVLRSYLYQVSTRRTAFAKPYVWWVKEPLDVDQMRAVAARFVGFHDFAAFAQADAKDEDASTRVLVERLDLVHDAALLLVGVEGSHFLWRMVRRLVGVLVAVGLGDLDPQQATTLLTGSSELPAKLTAPASGLFLERVFYQGDRRDVSFAPATPVRDAVPSVPFADRRPQP